MVLVHGYGGSGIMFWKILKPLTEHYHLILIDIIGMGASSRPSFDHIRSCKEADDYLVNTLEKWRQAMGDLKNFILAGHSFGGYVCGVYAIKYHCYIRKLLMLSPAGVMKRPSTFDLYEEITAKLKLQKRKPPRKCLVNCCFKCVGGLWEKRCSPFGVMRCCGRCCVACLMRNYVRRRFYSVP